jgi:putative membrane protein
MSYFKKHIPLFVAPLFHISGLIGILCTPYKVFFVNSTPVVLLTMFLLLASTEKKVAQDYFIFFVISFIIGLTTEIIGVNTGLLFGDYQYGSVLGPKLFGVPLLIGLNWFIIVFCSGSVCSQGLNFLQKKFDVNVPSSVFKIAVVIAGAAIATCFDIILEPAAVKLQFWSWENGVIPLFNYICWFSISVILLSVKMYFSKLSDQTFSIAILSIQAVFFLVLNMFL